MYTKGDAQIGEEAIYDDNYAFVGRTPIIELPHSCDEWVIGGVKEAQDLIDDLQELIKNFPLKT